MRTLRDETYRILTTVSATEALRRIEQGGVDLLLTDLDMPEMSGLELLHRVRSQHPDVVRMLPRAVLFVGGPMQGAGGGRYVVAFRLEALFGDGYE